MLKETISVLQKRLFRFIRKDFVIILISLVLAIAAWFIVSITVYPTTITTITDIPVSPMDLTDTAAEKSGLSIVSAQIPESVSIRIEGKRVEIGSLQSERMRATVIIPETVTEPGEYDLKIVVASLDGINYTLKEISPSSCKVEFDKDDFVEKKVKVEVSNVNAAEGFTYDSENISIEPDFVTIKGPKSRVVLITDVIVKLDCKGDELQAVRKYAAEEIIVKSGDSEMDIDSNKLVIEPGSFTVEIPIMKNKELPVKVNFTNVPEGFSTATLERVMKLSHESITFASPDNSIDNFSEFTLDIDMREISTVKNEISFDVSEIAKRLKMESFTNISNITELTVSFDMTDYTQKTFPNLNKFDIRNSPAGMTVVPISGSISLDFIGPLSQLEGEKPLSAPDISLVIDLSQVSMTKGQFTAPVIVSTPDFDGVWATSTPYITLRGKED